MVLDIWKLHQMVKKLLLLTGKTEMNLVDFHLTLVVFGFMILTVQQVNYLML